MDYYHVANRKQSMLLCRSFPARPPPSLKLPVNCVSLLDPATKLPWFLEGDSLNAPFPSYVIGSGAKTLPGLLHVSRMSGKASYSGTTPSQLDDDPSYILKSLTFVCHVYSPHSFSGAALYSL